MKTRDLKRYSSLILLTCVFWFSLCTQGAITYPRVTTYKYLNDYAGVVDRTNAQQIISLGSELEQKTGAQAIVVTMDTLNGYPIEDYANGLFRSWGIGQARQDNGLLILLVVQDAQWRVEVGRGLEGAIPDVLSNRIMEQLGKNAFIEGNYGQGLAQTYSQFCDDIATEYNTTLTHSLHTVIQTRPARRGISPVAYLVIVGIVFVDLLFNRGRLFRILFWSSFFGGGRNNRGGGGGYGGFGGGSSNGGGSSGGW